MYYYTVCLRDRRSACDRRRARGSAARASLSQKGEGLRAFRSSVSQWFIHSILLYSTRTQTRKQRHSGLTGKVCVQNKHNMNERSLLCTCWSLPHRCSFEMSSDSTRVNSRSEQNQNWTPVCALSRNGAGLLSSSYQTLPSPLLHWSGSSPESTSGTEFNRKLTGTSHCVQAKLHQNQSEMFHQSHLCLKGFEMQMKPWY